MDPMRTLITLRRQRAKFQRGWKPQVMGMGSISVDLESGVVNSISSSDTRFYGMPSYCLAHLAF